MVDLTPPDASPTPDMGDVSGRLVARVQAWQHRHPLARRLPAADVTGLGVIALPYGPADAGGQPQPLFHQPSLVPGLSHRALVDFAQRHAVSYRPGPPDWPQRHVERSDASPEPPPETRYLLTAAVTEPVAPGALPRRLLIAPEGSAIWGARPLSRPRVLAALAALVLVLGAAGWGVRAKWMSRAPEPVEPVATAASAVPSPASAVAAAASIPMAVPAHAPASVAAPNLPPLASTPPSPSVAPSRVAASAPVQPLATPAARVASAVAAPAVVVAKASAPAVHAASAAAPPSLPPASAILPAPKLLPMPTQRGAPAVSAPAPALEPAASVALPAGPHFALVSLPSKKRAGAEAMQAQVRKLLGPAIGHLQVQIMPSPEGFVVTIWPLPTQADAERLAEVLARRGVPMKWLEF